MGNPRKNTEKKVGREIVPINVSLEEPFIKAKMVVKLSQRVFKEFVVSLLMFPCTYNYSNAI